MSMTDMNQLIQLIQAFQTDMRGQMNALCDRLDMLDRIEKCRSSRSSSNVGSSRSVVANFTSVITPDKNSLDAKNNIPVHAGTNLPVNQSNHNTGNIPVKYMSDAGMSLTQGNRVGNGQASDNHQSPPSSSVSLHSNVQTQIQNNNAPVIIPSSEPCSSVGHLSKPEGQVSVPVGYHAGINTSVYGDCLPVHSNVGYKPVNYVKQETGNLPVNYDVTGWCMSVTSQYIHSEVSDDNQSTSQNKQPQTCTQPDTILTQTSYTTETYSNISPTDTLSYSSDNDSQAYEQQTQAHETSQLYLLENMRALQPQNIPSNILTSQLEQMSHQIMTHDVSPLTEMTLTQRIFYKLMSPVYIHIPEADIPAFTSLTQPNNTTSYTISDYTTQPLLLQTLPYDTTTHTSPQHDLAPPPRPPENYLCAPTQLPQAPQQSYTQSMYDPYTSYYMYAYYMQYAQQPVYTYYGNADHNFYTGSQQ